MASLEELVPGAAVLGLESGGVATIIAAKWYGDAALELAWKNEAGEARTGMLYRDDEAGLTLKEKGLP